MQFCVAWTAQDAAALGFTAHIVTDAVRASAEAAPAAADEGEGAAAAAEGAAEAMATVGEGAGAGAGSGGMRAAGACDRVRASRGWLEDGVEGVESAEVWARLAVPGSGSGPEGAAVAAEAA